MIAQLDRAYWTSAGSRTVVRLLSYALFEGRPATTRGRWINPLVLSHLRLATRFPVDDDRIERPVFIVGLGRSGTTLLGTILGVHPHVGFLNEPKALWHVAYDQEDVIGSYAPEPGRLRLTAAEVTPDVRARARAMAAHYLRVTRSRRMVDKYPELVFRPDFVRAIFPDALFVVVQRRAWDVISSVATWSELNGNADEDWWGLHDRKWHTLWSQGVQDERANHDLLEVVDPSRADHRVRSAVEWIVTTREALQLQAAGTPGVHLLRYEDLLDRPAEVVAALLDACGLPPSAEVDRFVAQTVRPARKSIPDAADLPERLQAIIRDVLAQAGY